MRIVATIACFWTCLAGHAASTTLASQEPPAAAAPRTPAPAKFVAGKPELARAYVELERLMMEKGETLAPGLVAEVNRGFDNAANSFFMGDYSGAVRRIDAELEKLDPAKGLRSIGVRMDPMVVRVGPDVQCQARFSPIYDAHRDANSSWTIDIACGHDIVPGARGERIGSIVLSGSPFGNARKNLSIASATPTRWEIRCFDDAVNGRWCIAGPVYSTVEPLDTLRTSLLETLDGLDAKHAELAPALAACRSRVRLLSDRPSLDNTYMIVGNLLELVEQTKREASELVAGRDPYAGAPGDFWLTLHIGDGDVPARFLAPRTEHPETPRPLIIAVHGAGGDENLWMDGYGAGELRKIAQEKNLLVVTPRVGLGTFMPGSLDALVEAVARWHAVDRSRVYVIGHSLGGGVVTAWAKQRPETIAAACSIAGVGVFTGTKEIAPMLAYAGEIDGLILADRIRRSAQAAKTQGLPVEYREVANFGHVLVVGQVARPAVEWLLEHRRAEPAAAKDPAAAHVPATPSK